MICRTMASRVNDVTDLASRVDDVTDAASRVGDVMDAASPRDVLQQMQIQMPPAVWLCRDCDEAAVAVTRRL